MQQKLQLWIIINEKLWKSFQIFIPEKFFQDNIPVKIHLHKSL
jgi:hypothetical protein